MSSDTRTPHTSPARSNEPRKPFSPNQPLSRHGSRKTLRVTLASGAKKPAGPEAKLRGKVDHERPDPQEVQKMLKFRTSILVLDPCATLFADGDPLKVVHSKCKGKITQKAPNDVSNFREHVSICQSIHPGVVAPARPRLQPCPGFNFAELCGRGYKSLQHHERQQVTSATEAAGFVWLDPQEKSSVVSKSCLRESPSYQGPARPCRGCSSTMELSNFKETVCGITSRPKYEFFNPFLSTDATATGDGGD